MVRIVGEIDTHPWLMVTVETPYGRRVIKFLIDTGFAGEIAVPRSYTSLFGIFNNLNEAEFADGVHADLMTVECRVDWIGGWRNADVMYIDGRYPLIGMELLDNCLITIETSNGRGEIIIEDNR